MITSETPYKLAEIIRDTWPQLFWLKDSKVNSNDNKYIKSSDKGVV
jgi:hypothetical protein